MEKLRPRFHDLLVPPNGSEKQELPPGVAESVANILTALKSSLFGEPIIDSPSDKQLSIPAIPPSPPDESWKFPQGKRGQLSRRGKFKSEYLKNLKRGGF